MEVSRLGAALLLSRIQASAGDPLSLYIAIVNQSAADLAVTFPTAQQFDFALLDKHGTEYWRWSTGKVFTQNQTSISVAAGRFHVAGDALAAIPLPNPVDEYVTLIGELTSSSLPFVGRLRIDTP